MSHEIMDDTRVLGRKSMWHGLGTIIPQGFTAVEGIELIGEWDIRLAPITTIDPFSGEPLLGEQQVIVRQPIGSETQGKVLGRPVSGQFEIITPRMAAEAYDKIVVDEEGVTAPVQAMGYLGNGDAMWITTQCPSFGVKSPNGSEVEVENYLLYWNPLSPDAAAYVLHVPIIVVCRNTAEMALENARLRFSVPHKTGAYKQLQLSLKQAWRMGQEAINESQVVAKHLMQRPLSDDQMQAIVKLVYKMPNPPKKGNFVTSYSDRLERVEREEMRVKTLRTTVMGLFHTGTGIEEMGMSGTTFAGLMAFSELTSFINTNAGEEGLKRIVAGDHANTLHHAKELLMEV